MRKHIVKKWREENGKMGQAEFAALVGAKQYQISRIEEWKCITPLDLGISISKHTGIPIEKLVQKIKRG